MSSGAALGKGGKAKAGRPAKEVLDEIMAARLAELKAFPSPHQAKVILSIDGMGFQGPDGQFTDKKPGKTKGKSSHHFSDKSFIAQFYITVGFGKGFASTMLVAVANPVFFKGGDVGKGKIIDGAFNVGDYVFTREAEGTASVDVVSGMGRFSGVVEQHAIRYQDLYAVLHKPDVPGWVAEGKLYM